MLNKLKSWYYTKNEKTGYTGRERLLVELESAWHTFVILFLADTALMPAINQLFNVDFPTIQDIKDVIPVLIDTTLRSLWLTALTMTGLIKYRNKR